MADKTDKQVESVEGKFYVDTQCIDCDLCRDTAPDFFTRSDNGYSYVYNQPVSEVDIQLCEDCVADCPVEAIGTDG